MTSLTIFTGKMENILNEDSVSDQTQILLVNAAYFVTNWMKKFPEAEIKECPFKVNKVRPEIKQSTPSTQMNVCQFCAKEISMRASEKYLLLLWHSQTLCQNLCAVAKVPELVFLLRCQFEAVGETSTKGHRQQVILSFKAHPQYIVLSTPCHMKTAPLKVSTAFTSSLTADIVTYRSQQIP